MEPRRLSTDQRARLVALLSHGPKGKVLINCVMGDGEGQAFTNDIFEVLKASGWPVGDVSQAAYSGANPIGFGIIVHRMATAPQFAGALQNAFFSVGFPMGGLEDANMPEDTVEILVGNKPSAVLPSGSLH